MGEHFQLSKWFNGGLGKGGTLSAHSTDSEDADASAGFASGGRGATTSGGDDMPEVPECYICHVANPEYMSTTSVKKAPSVPVCSIECETEYLDRKGLRPKGERTYEMVGLGSSECFVCHKANPEYMTTNKVKVAPSVSVCSVECEGKYLQMKKTQFSSGALSPQLHKVPRSSSSSSAIKKRGKRDGDEKEGDDAKRPRRSLNFLQDHLLGNDNANAYKSWWLGALTFYDFVYQRHGMWHRYAVAMVDFRGVGGYSTNDYCIGWRGTIAATRSTTALRASTVA